jgi:hypothetical protein
MLRQTEVGERISARLARKPAHSLRSTQAAIAPRLRSQRSVSAGKPPIDSAQRSPSSASSTASIEGVLIVSPLKMPSISLPPLVRRNSFGIGQAGRWDSSRSTARGDRTSMPCCASPPSTFCQDQVTTSSLGQGSGIAKAAEVASHKVRPARSSRIQPPSGTRTPDVVPFQQNTVSRAGSTALRSGNSP